MLRVRLKVTLTIEGPVLTKSASIGDFGLDAVMAKTSGGKYCLPGTLVRGRLRQAWQELHDVINDDYKSLLGIEKSLNDFSTEWLGRESGNKNNKGQVSPQKVKLYFTDFILKKSDTDKCISRIKINEQLGSAKKGSLLIMEAPLAPGEEAEFTGTIDYIAKDEGEAKRVHKCVEIGLKWVPSFGGKKTIGFGRLLRISVAKEAAPPDIYGREATGRDFLDILLAPSAPFCFARRQVKDNLFESDEVISGGAIKGAIADVWGAMINKRGSEVDHNFDPDRKELSENFEKVRFTHAFPFLNETGNDRCHYRPVVMPFSLVKVKDKQTGRGTIYDVAFQKEAVLINGRAPAFSMDWKESTDVEKFFGWEKSPDRELRVRTAMDRQKRKAKDKALFAYEMVIPDGFRWGGRIDLSRIDDEQVRKKAESQLFDILCSGMLCISKTKVSTKVDIQSTGLKNKLESKCEPINKNGINYWIITLQTPMVLCRPSNLNEASTCKELFNEYSRAWLELSEETLNLSHYFASQTLAGGYYLHRRFQDGKPYRPYLLTNAGSVFVLTETKKDEAKDKIKSWLKKGLDFPNWAKKDYARDKDKNDGGHWTNCPYIPENGYGEIAVNLHESYPEEIRLI